MLCRDDDEHATALHTHAVCSEDIFMWVCFPTAPDCFFGLLDYTDSHLTVSGKCYQMSSFCETKAEKLIEGSAKDFVAYNARHLSRIYPSGTRTGSSNYKPTPFWNVGCQMGTSVSTLHV
jgi:hypothetical protein